MPTHDIPTHLHVADRVVAGCTWSQLFTLSAAAAVAFWGWQILILPHVAHVVICAMPLLAGLACAFWRPEGHGLLTWLGLATTYALTPRRILWSHEAANVPLIATRAGVHATNAPATDRRTVRRSVKQPAVVSARLRHPMIKMVGLGQALRVLVAWPRTMPMSSHVQPSDVGRVGTHPWTMLMGYRVLCLSTHHMLPANRESRA